MFTDDVLTSTKTVAEEIRIRILLLLMDREACVCELMSVFDMAQSKVSHHLLMLSSAGLLQDERRGKWNYYRVNTKSLNQINRQLLVSLSRWLIDDKIIERDKKVLDKVKERMQIC